MNVRPIGVSNHISRRKQDPAFGIKAKVIAEKQGQIVPDELMQSIVNYATAFFGRTADALRTKEKGLNAVVFDFGDTPKATVEEFFSPPPNTFTVKIED